MRHFLEFERPIAELEGKIDELRRLSNDSGLNIAEEVGRLEAQVTRLVSQSYAKLTPWQKVQVARHPERPHCLRLYRRADRRVHAARRRPRLRRGCGRDRRDRPVSRAQRRRARHREGRRHRGAREAQFRHGAPGRLSQGAAADAPRRALRAAGADLYRHGRRLSRGRCRGARAERGDRRRDRDLSRHPRAAGRRRLSAKAARAAQLRWPPAIPY